MRVKFNNWGFTLVEMMVVIFIIVTILTITIADYRGGESRTSFGLETDVLASNIRQMETASLTGQVGNQDLGQNAFGIYLNINTPDRYILFRDNNGDNLYTAGTDSAIQTVSFENGVSLSTLNFPTLSFADMVIVFTPPKPDITISTNTLNGEGVPTYTATQGKVYLISSKVSDARGVVDINAISGRVQSQLIANQ